MKLSNINNSEKSIKQLRILKIQRTCIHDGPGIRTVIFFPSCKLRCLWCHNPEAQNSQHNIDDEYYSVDDIISIIKKDKEYYLKTHGGVTFSGGEPLLQNSDEFTHLIKQIKKENISLSIETAGHVPWKNIEKIAHHIDLFLFDLKIVSNDDLHLKYTQQDSKLIHTNIQQLIAIKANIQFRKVIVPGFNDMPSNIKATADFLKSINHNSITLLKYHNIHETKTKRLDIPSQKLNITHDHSIAAIRKSEELFKSQNITTERFDVDYFKADLSFPKRVHEIQDSIRESDTHLCLESSSLKTKFYRKNGFKKPTHIHRAERLNYLLNNKSTIIYTNELIVGNFTAKRVGGHAWEEYYGFSLVSIIHQINRQKPVSFKCSFKDKLNFYFNIFPFWVRHNLTKHVNQSISDFLLYLSRYFDLKIAFQNNQAAIAHFIANHGRILKLGTIGIIKDIENKQIEYPENNQDFYLATIIALKGLEQFAKRYSNELKKLSQEEIEPNRRRELEKMSSVCANVPLKPAKTFHEALQSIMLVQIALCTESFENAISFGRLDKLLYPYYKKDKEAGLITYDQAKELLACFVLKVDEVIIVNDGETFLGVGKLFESLSTVQTVTFGGMDEDSSDITNDVTYMLLDVCELQPRGINMAARIHNNSPSKYLERIAEIYIKGSPVPALFNDEIYIKTLMEHYPTSIKNARDFSIVGCVEPVASSDHFGNTDCANINVVLPFLQALKGEDNDLWNYGILEQLKKFIVKLLSNRFTNNISNKFYNLIRIIKRLTKLSSYNLPKNIDELLDRYQERMNYLASSVLKTHYHIENALRQHFTTPLASSLFEGCIKRGKDAYEGGTDYNSSGIQAIGITDVADSFYAIDEIVFKRKLFTLKQVVSAIDDNFKSEFNQTIRKQLLEVPKFGNDSSATPHQWVNKVLQVYNNALDSVESRPRNGIYTAGYYALNVNIVYGSKTQALPSGRLNGVPLAHSVSPHYGMQMQNLVSPLNSISNINFAKYAPNGTTVTFTIDSSMFQTKNGTTNLAGIISAYFKKGGMQFQPNVINREILLDAYKHPHKHKYLLVRIAGYCGYFNDLTDDLKKAIINRTCYL